MNDIIYTHRTKSGLKARILNEMIDNEDRPILVAIYDGSSESVELYTRDLRWSITTNSMHDLVEYSPWNEVEVDTRVLVRDSMNEPWIRRYFSHFDDNRVHAFPAGSTSWSSEGADQDTIPWEYAKLAE